MTTLPPTLRELAEEPDHHLSHVPLPVRRIVTPRFTIVLSPSPNHSATSTIRTTVEELDATIAEVRTCLRENGYLRNAWTVGPSCRPLGLEGLLLERGFVPATRTPFEPASTAMALYAPPAIAAAKGVEARVVRSLEEYREVLRIAMIAFDESPESAAAWDEAVPGLWAAHDGVNRYTHLAFLDGQPVGFGFAASCNGGVLLGGSGVLEAARGRGVYRSLVAARWEEARRLGHAGLIIHAGAMSKPILERCGFEAICEVKAYEDLRLVPAP